MVEIHQGQGILPEHGVCAEHRACDQLVHNVLVGHERRAGSCHDRRDDHVEFLHDHERFSVVIAGRRQPDGHERVGERMHVLHLHVAHRIRRRQLSVSHRAQAELHSLVA